MAGEQGQDLLDQVAGETAKAAAPQQPAAPAPAPAQAPAQGGDLLDQIDQESKQRTGEASSIAETSKSWWDSIEPMFTEGLAAKTPTASAGPVGAAVGIFRKPGENVGETLSAADAAMDKIVQHEISSAHPYRAQIADYFKRVGEDSAKFLNSQTSPLNLGLMFASGGSSVLVHAGLMAANLYFGYKGADEMLKERQANETLADELERRGMGAAGLLFGTSGAGTSSEKAIELQRKRIQSKLGISGNLADKANQKVAEIDRIRQQGVQEASTDTLKGVQEAGDILDQVALERGQKSVEPAVDSAARAAGVMPEGEQGPFYRFRDGVTGGAFSVRKSDFSPEAVRSEAAKTRKAIGPPKPDDDPLVARSRAEKKQRVEAYLASPPKGTGAAGALEEAQQQIPVRMGQVVRDAAHAVYAENARVSKPFQEFAARAKTPVSDSQSVRATIIDTIKSWGIQDGEIPPRIFAALFRQGKSPNEWMDIPSGPIAKTIPDIEAGLQEVNKPVSFDDLTRVRGDLFDAAQSATDGKVANSLYDAYDGITKMQEKYADMHNFGDEYRAAKDDYKRFKRELGNGTMRDFLKADDFMQQAMTPKLAKIMTGKDAVAMRDLFKFSGVDVSPLDEMIAQRNTASKTLAAGGKEQVKAAATAMKTAAKAGQVKLAARETEAKALGKESSVVPESGIPDIELKGKATEQIRRAALDRMSTNARQAGISNPMAMFMLVYGSLRLGMGSPFGAYPAARGGAAVVKTQGAKLLRNPAYQDWVIRESGVDPSNTKLIGRLRKGLAALANTATSFVKNPPQPDEDQQ